MKRKNMPIIVMTAVHKGADDLIRTVWLKTQKGELKRSIEKLDLLEEHKEQICDKTVKEIKCILERATMTGVVS